MARRRLSEVDPATLAVLLPVALGPAAVATLAGEVDRRACAAARALVHRIRSERSIEAMVRRCLSRELSEPRVERTVAALGAMLREAVLEGDYRAIAAVTWVAATSEGLAWRRLEERSRDALVLTALWSMRQRGEERPLALAAK